MSVMCELCHKSYDNYMRTFYAEDKVVCPECFRLEIKKIRESGKYYYFPHIPSFCEGFDVKLETFDDIKKLSKKLNKLKDSNEVLATDSSDLIKTIVMCVNKKNNIHRVCGYSNGVEELNLPDYNTILEGAEL